MCSLYFKRFTHIVLITVHCIGHSTRCHIFFSIFFSLFISCPEGKRHAHWLKNEKPEKIKIAKIEKGDQSSRSRKERESESKRESFCPQGENPATT